MEVVFTSRFVKDLKNIKSAKHKKATDEVVNTIQNATDFVQLHTLIDIKKLNTGLGGYRIRYTNNPEYRIRIDLLENAQDKTKKVVELQRCMTREEYEKYAKRKINESIELNSKKLTVVLTESQFKRLVEYSYQGLYEGDEIRVGMFHKAKLPKVIMQNVLNSIARKTGEKTTSSKLQMGVYNDVRIPLFGQLLSFLTGNW